MPEPPADQAEALAGGQGAGATPPKGEKEAIDEPAGWGEPGCPDCLGTGWMGPKEWTTPCGCVAAMAEARRQEAEAGTVHDSGLELMGAARNADGAPASVDELADRSPDETRARRLAPSLLEALPEPGEAVVVQGSGRAGVLAALAVLETRRRAGARVLALNDAEARQEDLEKGPGDPGPVAMGRANGLGLLLLEMAATSSHPKWAEKLAAFATRARRQGAALIVATGMGPDRLAAIHGPALVDALGGPDAWKGGGR